MSDDSYTEVSSTSWFGRIGSAFKGIVVGLILLAIAFVLLFWNEGRAVKRYKTLKEGGGAVVSVAADRVDPANEGRLIHLGGWAETEEVLHDAAFGVEARAIKLKRLVEMYQWRESSENKTEKKLGGGTETITTYRYEKTWSESMIGSGSFKKPEGHRNPDSMPHHSEELVADTVQLGGFTLSPSLKAEISGYSDLALDGGAAIPTGLGSRVQRQANGFYLGENTGDPEVGDLRVRFAVVLPAEISVIAAQNGASFRPYQTSVGGAIELLQPGLVPAEAMIAKAQQSNRILTWVLRALGFLLMFFGLRMILAPLSVFADVVPLFGSIVGAGAGLIAGLIAAILSAITVSLAWLVYRPLIGGTLLAVALGMVVLVVMRLKKADPSTAPIPPPPPPPPGA